MAMKIRPMLDYVKDGLEKVARCSAVGSIPGSLEYKRVLVAVWDDVELVLSSRSSARA